jgi:type I restriction enzyme, R subunit
LSPITKLDEENLVEIPAENIFKSLNYNTENGYDLHPKKEKAERNNFSEVILHRAIDCISKINPDIPLQTVEIALQQVKNLGSPSIIENNIKFHKMLISGVKVTTTGSSGKTETKVVKLIEFDKSKIENNDFLAVRQFVVEQGAKRRADHIVFVNGLPLVILEYKDPTQKNATPRDAYNQLGETEYQRDIPRLFYYNSFLVVSDGTIAKYGTFTAKFERFTGWKDPNKNEKKIEFELEIMLRGMFEKSTLLNIIQNFVEFESDGKKIIKKIAMNHQYFAVEKAVNKTKQVLKQKDEKRIGIVWHTTGSGKSLTMILYSHLASKIPELENPTFVIITDRTDLDEQLHGFFKKAGFPYPRPDTAILEAEGIEDLREQLNIPSGKIIFTTIQKFQTTKEEKETRELFPKISDRKNIIIIADEAHRTQYKGLAQNLRRALPNAMIIGFTGTPIEKDDRSTTEVFGDVISSYTIPEAVEDGATVQISYEGRLQPMHLLDQLIGQEFDAITESIEEPTQKSLTSKWTQFKVLVEDPDRIKKIAEDIVIHFNGREINGKAMIVTATQRAAVLYKKYIDALENSPESIVAISGTKRKVGDESDELIPKHVRTKKEMKQVIEDFKDENNPKKLLIVCDMLLTGFDAPLLHTMYIDKPLRDHTLIQAISRVNRVYKDKPGGLIVDYIGIADDLKKSFRAYSEGDIKTAMVPTKEIIKLMKKKHEEALKFFKIPLQDFFNQDKLNQIKMITEASNEIIVDDNTKKSYFKTITELSKAYAVVSPNPVCLEIKDDLMVLKKIKQFISKYGQDVPEAPEDVESAIRKLVERGIGPDDVIRELGLVKQIGDTLVLDENALKNIKKIKQKNLKVELAHKLLDNSVRTKFTRNLVKRHDFLEKIEKTISKYHGRFEEYETLVDRLIGVGQEVINSESKQEELKLSEEEMAFYDAVSLGRDYINSDEKIRSVSIDVTEYLKRNTTIDWLNQESVKAKIRSGVKKVLLSAGFDIKSLDILLPKIMENAQAIFGER